MSQGAGMSTFLPPMRENPQTTLHGAGQGIWKSGAQGQACCLLAQEPRVGGEASEAARCCYSGNPRAHALG